MGLISAFQKNFTRWNKIIFILALLFSGASLVALFKVAPKSDMQNFKALATLTERNNQVTRKFSNSLSFTDVSEGDSLYGGDQVFTGKDSSAKVVFSASKNELSIPSDSLIVIDSVNSVENVEIKKGLAEFFIKKDQVMNIVKNEEVITIAATEKENSSGKISFSKDQKLVLSVSQGELNVNEGKGIRKVSKNETMQIKVAPVVVKAKVFAMDRPAFGESIDIWKGIPLAWSTPGQIEVILSKNKDFSDIVDKTFAQSSPHTWAAPIEVGRYYLKVRTQASGEEVILPLTMKSSQELTSFTPANNDVVTLNKGEKLKLSWNEVPAKFYKIKITESDGQSKIFESQTAQAQISQIKSSEISWQVAPVLNSGVELPYSGINRVSIKYNGNNKILSPLSQSKYQWKKSIVKLAWETLPGEEFNVKISEGKNRKVVFERNSREASMDFSPTTPGEFTFDLTSKDHPEIPGASVNFYVIGKIADWKESAVVNLESVDEAEKAVELSFNPNTEDFSSVEFVVYKDSQLLDKRLISRKVSNTLNYKLKKYGNYCFELRSAKDLHWLSTGQKCFVYKNIPAFSTLPVANNIVLKFIRQTGPEGYTIELPVIEHAAQYEIQVFQDIKGTKSVYTDKSKTNTLKWYTKKSGAFYYRYRVMDSKGHQSGFSGIARLIFPISPLTEWRE